MEYFSMNLSLRFCILQYTKSYTTSDVLMKWSLRFVYCAVQNLMRLLEVKYFGQYSL